MEVIFDTNALSAFGDQNQDLLSLMGNVQRVWIPAVVLGEYRFGLIGSNRPGEASARLERVLELFEILTIDGDTSRHYAEVRMTLKLAGLPIPVNDLWIAALTRQTGMPLITRDRHFQHVEGIAVMSW